MSNLEDWGIDGLIKNGGVMILNKKEVNLMKTKVIRSGDKNFEEEKAKMFEPKTLSKVEQLRAIFKNTLEDWGYWIDDNGKIKEYNLAETVNKLLYEVKIRVKL